MLFKRVLCVLLIAALCSFAGCDGEDTDGSTSVDGTSETELPMPESYEDHRNIFMDKPLDVTVTLTVDMTPAVENRFSLKEEQSGYILTDLFTDKQVIYDEDADEEEIFKIAGYLPPYEAAYENGGGYGVRFAGDLALEMLLSGSNLFNGYGIDNVTLDGECTYSAVVDYGITGYSYEFSVNVNDGGATFPAKVKYLIEVNK